MLSASSPRRRGPIPSVAHDADHVGYSRKQLANNNHRWLWVPACAGTTSVRAQARQ
jgi:hypothetical protein